MKDIIRQKLKQMQVIYKFILGNIKINKFKYSMILCCIFVMSISVLIAIKGITAINNMQKIENELLYTKNKLHETKEIVIKLDNELSNVENTNIELSKELKSKDYLEAILKDLSYRWDRK